MVLRIEATLIGYFFGNFLFAMIIGKFFLKKNPIKYGSGNPGTANMGAVFGKKWGIMTCTGDLAKTVIALLIVYIIFVSKIYLIYSGLGLVLGHCFPVWNHFQGGKGVTVAILLAVVYNFQAGIMMLLVALLLTAVMQNLTIPPLVFILLFSVDMIFKDHEAGIVLIIISMIMVFKFGRDIIDFCNGKGKKVDILYTIKKKLGLKVQ